MDMEQIYISDLFISKMDMEQMYISDLLFNKTDMERMFINDYLFSKMDIKLMFINGYLFSKMDMEQMNISDKLFNKTVWKTCLLMIYCLARQIWNEWFQNVKTFPPPQRCYQIQTSRNQIYPLNI